MIFTRAKLEKLSMPMQALVFVAVPAPLFAAFAIAGDLSRGTLVWAFSTALLNALYACGEKAVFTKFWPPTVVLLVLHIGAVIWNPLRRAPLLGGLFLPIALLDYCIDYAFLWSWLKVFRMDD